jgi:hypothetical protein
MELERTAHWIQIVGNIGLLAGLILVGSQLYQTNQLAKADLTSREYELTMQYFIAMMGENPAGVWAKAATNPASMTAEDLVVLNAYTTFWGEKHVRDDLLIEYDLMAEHRDFLEWHAKTTYGGNRVVAALWRSWLEDEESVGRAWDWQKTVTELYPDDTDHDSKFIEYLMKAAKDSELQAPGSG